VIGLLALWLRELLPVELLSSWGERLVGVLLLGIGIWGIRRVLKHKVHAHEHEHDGERHVHVHVHSAKTAHEHANAHHHAHAAFGIGILHGLAGSSHFLGVLPTLALPTLTQAVSYLIAFGVGTVVSMAFFSWIMGLLATTCSMNSTRAYNGLMAFCSVAAIGVGCFWLFAQ
jgi:ABC-type nickel/cobalt efflux system permease component RcnA